MENRQRRREARAAVDMRAVHFVERPCESCFPPDGEVYFAGISAFMQ